MDNHHGHVGVYDKGGDFGGSSAQQVFSSASRIYQDVAPPTVDLWPEIQAGLVVAGSDAVLAGKGDFWYWMSFSGGDANNTALFTPIMTAIAGAIA
ncbi:hypothetical protein [Tsukamurella sp. NPDC003166]|uniref:hypothetical protein n=1 Tax=Tsukamurella sp. NPDC003166 TaxID=3154444 RepID=UPI0033BE4AA3